jgi:acetyltransferase-like isoleucine patch superfamily enzyme
MIANLIQLIQFVARNIRQRYLHFCLRRRGVKLASSSLLIGHCEISKGVMIGLNTVIVESKLDGRGGLTIGNNVIMNRASIITASHDFDSPALETTYGSVTIDDYAVLLTGSMILPGRRIGRGTVVAAGSVVTHDVPDMAIVAGNPARVIRYRADVHHQINTRRMVGFAPHQLQVLRARMHSIFTHK